MTRSTTKAFCRFLPGAVMAFALQLAMSSVASASCGDYLLHRSLEPNSSASRSLASESPNADEPHFPSPSVPSTPCRGMNCSKQIPLAPVVPLRLHWQHHDQWCFLAMRLVVSHSSISSGWLWLKTECQPIHGSFRLDRPPQVG
jgi:hypothetical protein